MLQTPQNVASQSFYTPISRERRSVASGVEPPYTYSYCAEGQTTCCLHRFNVPASVVGQKFGIPGIQQPLDFEINECRGECPWSSSGKVYHLRTFEFEFET